MRKLEFAGPEWVEELQRQLEDGLAGEDLTGIDYTLSEEYLNAPDHLRNGSPTIGFWFRIRDGEVTFGLEPLPDDEADFKAVVDYSVAQALSRRTHAEIAEDPELAVTELIASGKLQLKGDLTGRPEALVRVGLHDRIAAHTA